MQDTFIPRHPEWSSLVVPGSFNPKLWSSSNSDLILFPQLEVFRWIPRRKRVGSAVSVACLYIFPERCKENSRCKETLLLTWNSQISGCLNIICMIRKCIHVLDNFIMGFTKCLRVLLLKRMLKDDPHMQLTKFKSIFTWLPEIEILLMYFLGLYNHHSTGDGPTQLIGPGWSTGVCTWQIWLHWACSLTLRTVGCILSYTYLYKYPHTD